MINNLKLRIKNEVLTYIPNSSGMTIRVIEIDQGFSELEFDNKPNTPSVAWYYPYTVLVTYPTGNMGENDRIALDNATNDYRLAISEQMAKKVPISIDNETGEFVKLTDINSFQRILDEQLRLYVFTINLQYKHIETY